MQAAANDFPRKKEICSMRDGNIVQNIFLYPSRSFHTMP